MNTTRTSTQNGNYSTGPSGRGTAADTAKEYASEAIDHGAEYVEQAQDAAVEKLGELETAIRRNPLQAAAIAAGVGFVFALIARR